MKTDYVIENTRDPRASWVTKNREDGERNWGPQYRVHGPMEGATAHAMILPLWDEPVAWWYYPRMRVKCFYYTLKIGYREKRLMAMVRSGYLLRELTGGPRRLRRTNGNAKWE